MTNEEYIHKSTASQCNMVLQHIRSQKNITATQALELYGIFRLAARVFDLKQKGHNIKSAMVKSRNGKRFAMYYI